MKPVISAKQHFSCRAFLLSVIGALLIACSNITNQAPIRERQQPPTQKIFQHVVAPRETLFSIAWRYGLDYKRLATINGIDAGFIIHPGEVLDLRIDQGLPVYQQSIASKKSSTSLASITESPSKSAVTIATPPQLRKRSSSKSSVNLSGEKVSTVHSSSTKLYDQRIVWQWPIAGKVISKFSGARGLNKGIDIKAKKGDRIIAAAAGTVVYAGSGLRGYGKLLIIKHNDIFLSAYGHNSRLRVREGSRVTAGQHIADAGASGTNTSKLHFEIRRDGKPVNPLSYLPKR